MEALKKIRNTPVSELMQRDVITIDGSQNVAQAIQLMKTHKVASLVVVPRNDDDAFGILTVRDILGKVIDPGEDIYRDIWNTQVHDIMNKPVFSIDPTMRVKYALRMMNKLGVRRLVVLRGNELAGIISEIEIFRAVEELPAVAQVAL
ncbi:CBS domain-containing protein [Geobacter sp.]|uniref:CBS domain-containing protein n=1 Tax=Geobacter sp. TaxID=46610 RepID=UPI001ACE1A01|nr:CBS domain-containing protein [Geobacter sp.]CAG0982629.1 Hypoxic response protein 1 [Geobacteraceae bacterium]